MTACTIPPTGWRCTRAPGHEGPCAAVRIEATPATIHPSHDVREEGIFVSDPVCQRCRCGVEHSYIFQPCPGEPPKRVEVTRADRLFAQSWWDHATPAERQAMAEIARS
jgi:hypothetical protein